MRHLYRLSMNAFLVPLTKFNSFTWFYESRLCDVNTFFGAHCDIVKICLEAKLKCVFSKILKKGKELIVRSISIH